MTIADRNIADMIENPSNYGFEWGYGPLSKDHGTTRVTLISNAPHIIHKDLDKLRKTFGDDYFLSSSNGTSPRVRDQKLRDDIAADPTLKNRMVEMKTIVLERAFGVTTRKSRVTIVEKIVEKRVAVYVANDGTEFEDKMEMLQYNKMLAVDEQLAKDEVTE